MPQTQLLEVAYAPGEVIQGRAQLLVPTLGIRRGFGIADAPPAAEALFQQAVVLSDPVRWLILFLSFEKYEVLK